MIPTQPKKWPQTIVGICVFLFLVKNPEAAAAGVQTLGDSLSRFVDAF
ncbi:hypothetical protein [Actinocorallia longicatena]|uniref:Sec-independent protein translocase protein TatA n=1 Tax=Actinocorallia longicatena TaxID=111803 RepID=A0ABP6QEA0_9ACTN